MSISGYSPIFTYFDLQLGRPHWREKKVLDFGGNVGNVIRDPNSTVDQSNYWCLDVSKDAVERGRQEYPQAHWVFYDRFNWWYNPSGIPGLKIPDLGPKFDYVLSFSVFTHTNQVEMIELVTSLKTFLAVNGTLAFTFLDPHYRPSEVEEDPRTNLEYYLDTKSDSTIDVDLILERAKNARWCTVMNYKNLYIEDEDISLTDQDMMKRAYNDPRYTRSAYDTYYTAEYIKTLFQGAIILPPVNALRQHCCILRA